MSFHSGIQNRLIVAIDQGVNTGPSLEASCAGFPTLNLDIDVVDNMNEIRLSIPNIREFDNFNDTIIIKHKVSFRESQPGSTPTNPPFQVLTQGFGGFPSTFQNFFTLPKPGLYDVCVELEIEIIQPNGFLKTCTVKECKERVKVSGCCDVRETASSEDDWGPNNNELRIVSELRLINNLFSHRMRTRTYKRRANGRYRNHSMDLLTHGLQTCTIFTQGNGINCGVQHNLTGQTWPSDRRRQFENRLRSSYNPPNITWQRISIQQNTVSSFHNAEEGNDIRSIILSITDDCN